LTLQNQHLFKEIESLKPEMVAALAELVRVPAIAPENGGDGETQKAEKLMEIVGTVGFDRVEHHDSSDSRVSSGKRPNIIAYFYGESDAKRLWVVTHLDVVHQVKNHCGRLRSRLNRWCLKTRFMVGPRTMVNRCGFPVRRESVEAFGCKTEADGCVGFRGG
jgi:hypothetical protein